MEEKVKLRIPGDSYRCDTISNTSLYVVPDNTGRRHWLFIPKGDFVRRHGKYLHILETRKTVEACSLQGFVVKERKKKVEVVL
jgi:hypothetical protein